MVTWAKGVTMAARTRLVDAAALELREQISSGRWPVGMRLPAEPDLAAALGIGRNSAREAVGALVQAGMLERRQGSGTYVVCASELGTAITRHLVWADQRDVLEVRQALEVLAAKLAANRRTGEDIDELRRLLGARAEAVRSGGLPEMVGADIALHRFIARCAGNRVLRELYDSVLDAVRSNIAFNFEAEAGDDAAHVALVDAIARGDPTAAATVAENYLAWTGQPETNELKGTE
jgi:DNA-binding FadR family transcriptional regulator